MNGSTRNCQPNNNLRARIDALAAGAAGATEIIVAL